MKITTAQRKILAKGYAKGYITITDISREYSDQKTIPAVMKRFVDLGVVKADPDVNGKFNISDMEELKSLLVEELEIEKELEEAGK